MHVSMNHFSILLSLFVCVMDIKKNTSFATVIAFISSLCNFIFYHFELVVLTIFLRIPEPLVALFSQEQAAFDMQRK